MPTDLLSGVFFALALSVFANLITPMTRTALLALFLRLGNGMKALGKWGMRRALQNSEKELIALDEFHSSPGKFYTVATNILSMNLFVLWAIAIVFGLAIFGGWVPGRTATNAFFGLLGASTSIIGHLVVIQSLSEHLQAYETYRPELLKRINIFKSALESK